MWPDVCSGDVPRKKRVWSYITLNKVSMGTYTYPHKQLRKIKVAICNHQVDSPFMCDLMCAVAMYQQRKEYGHTWHWMYLFTEVFSNNAKLLHIKSNSLFKHINSLSASHDNWCTETLLNRIITAQCEGMGEVGSARYELALLPPCPSIRVLCYSNCQRSTHSHQQFKG